MVPKDHLAGSWAVKGESDNEVKNEKRKGKVTWYKTEESM